MTKARSRVTRSSVYLLSAAVAVSGCSSTVPRETLNWVRRDEVIAAARFPSPPLVVADADALHIGGLEPTDEERRAFEERRAKAIDAASSLGSPGGLDPRCLLLLPVCVPVVLMVAGTVKAVKTTKASREIAAMVPAADGWRLAELFRERATGGALQARVAELMEEPTGDARGTPRLRVALQSVELDYHGGHTLFIFKARARGVSADGVEWFSTEHVHQCRSRPLSEWTAKDDQAVRLALEEALDGLAGSIAATYAMRIEQ